jgi:phosphoglucomutase
MDNSLIITLICVLGGGFVIILISTSKKIEKSKRIEWERILKEYTSKDFEELEYKERSEIVNRALEKVRNAEIREEKVKAAKDFEILAKKFGVNIGYDDIIF